MNVDKAGLPYWEGIWTAKRPRARPASAEYLQKRFHRFLSTALSDSNREAKLLEVGCGASSALPYLAGELGFSVTGIDYSETACAQARANLARLGTAGEIICADLFDSPAYLRDRFDVVFSSGLVEHFSETSDCVRSLARFLKPGGLIITSIPNLTGICGTMQRIFNRPVFDVHVPLDRCALTEAHEKAGLEVVTCNYFMSTNFGIVNLNGQPRNSIYYLSKRVLLALLTRFSHAVWIAEDIVRPVPPNRFSSPYVTCIARKPEDLSSPEMMGKEGIRRKVAESQNADYNPTCS